MKQVGKQRRIIPIPWAFPVFPLANLAGALVGTNIESMACNLRLQPLLLRIYGTKQYILYIVLKEG